MPDTLTTNYSFTIVEEFGSVDSWGGKLNVNFVNIDTEIKNVSDVAEAKITGPAVAVADRIFVANGTTGKIAKDGGKTIAELDAVAATKIVGPASVVADRIFVANGTTGKIAKDGGKTIAELDAATASAASTASSAASTASTALTVANANAASDAAYNESTWNSNLSPPTKNAVRDKIESMLGKRSFWFPANLITPHTVNGPSSGLVEPGADSPLLPSKDFDPTTSEAAQFGMRMPKSWDRGPITYVVVWSRGAAVTNFGVTWGLKAVAIGTGDAIDAVFGSTVLESDIANIANDLYHTSESAPVTVGGTPLAGDYVAFRIARTPADAGDTLAVDARLHGVHIFYDVNAFTDD